MRRFRFRQRRRQFDKMVSTPTLDLIPPGSKTEVVGIEGPGWIVRRLGEMGFTPGTEVKVLRRAPLADPVEYEIRNYLVILRREEAALIHVQPIELPKEKEAEKQP